MAQFKHGWFDLCTVTQAISLFIRKQTLEQIVRLRQSQPKILHHINYNNCKPKLTTKVINDNFFEIIQAKYMI